MSFKDVEAKRKPDAAPADSVSWMLEVGRGPEAHSVASSPEPDNQSLPCVETHYCPGCQKKVRPRLWIYDRRWYWTEAQKVDCSVCKTTLTQSHGWPTPLLLGAFLATCLSVAWLSL